MTTNYFTKLIGTSADSSLLTTEINKQRKPGQKVFIVILSHSSIAASIAASTMDSVQPSLLVLLFEKPQIFIDLIVH